MEQSFESTSIAKHASGAAISKMDFDKAGERFIIMATDETWSAWKEVFDKHESGALYDIDSGGPFNEITDDEGNKKVYKCSPINHTQLRNLAGMDDAAVRELANHILEEPPKVFLQRPRIWTPAVSFGVWCTNKKQKAVLAKEIARRALELKVPDAEGVVDKDGAIVPEKWTDLKSSLGMTGHHMWVLLRTDEQWLRNQCGSGKKKTDIPDELGTAIDRAMANAVRSNDVRRCSRASVCKWVPTDKKFDPQLFINRGDRWTRCNSGPAMLEFCEAGIIDFRLFPKVEKMEFNSGQKFILEEAKKLAGNSICRAVNTWMLIFNSTREVAIEILVGELFPEHVVKREVQYVYSKGEPSFAWKHKDKVWYLQRPNRSYCNSKLVDATGEVPTVSAEEEEPLQSEDDMYKTREACRHDFPYLSGTRELRYEVYLRFLDKFVRDQGTVMLVFAGAKALSACSVSSTRPTNYPRIIHVPLCFRFWMEPD